MFKSLGLVAVPLLTLAAPAQAMVLGPDAAVCAPGSSAPAALVTVDGFKAHTGNLRVQVYGPNPDEFLEKGKWLKRIDLPVTRDGPMQICVALPHAGNYAIAVRHDVNGTGKSDWNDGGGFSRNPRLSLFSLKPAHSAVVMGFGAVPKPVNIVLNYRQGLSIGPIRTAQR